jgi:hypothetical protein
MVASRPARLAAILSARFCASVMAASKSLRILLAIAAGAVLGSRRDGRRRADLHRMEPRVENQAQHFAVPKSLSPGCSRGFSFSSRALRYAVAGGFDLFNVSQSVSQKPTTETHRLQISPSRDCVDAALLGEHLALLRRERARIQSVQKLGRCNGLFRITVEPPMDRLLVN